MPSKEALLGIEEQASYKGIISLKKMARFIEMFNSSHIVPLRDSRRSARFINDEELLYIDELLDNRIINRLLDSSSLIRLNDTSQVLLNSPEL